MTICGVPQGSVFGLVPLGTYPVEFQSIYKSLLLSADTFEGIMAEYHYDLIILKSGLNCIWLFSGLKY